MTGAEWLTRYIAPAVVIMAAGALALLGGLNAMKRRPVAERKWARAAAAAGLFVVLVGLAAASRYVLLWWVTTFILEQSVFAAAVWKGGWRERTIAAISPALFIVTQIWNVLAWPEIFMFPAMAWRSVSLGTVELAILLSLMARARRYWVLWACSIKLLDLIIALLALLGGGVSGGTWVIANNVWAFAFDALVLFGVYQRWREAEEAGDPKGDARQAGHAIDWVLSLRPAAAADAAR